MSIEAAETVGLKALAWLAGNDDLLPVFLGSTGAGIDALRNGAADPAFHAAVLDFLLMDDAWIQAFCDAEELGYSDPMEARAALPGGGAVHWT